MNEPGQLLAPAFLLQTRLFILHEGTQISATSLATDQDSESVTCWVPTRTWRHFRWQQRLPRHTHRIPLAFRTSRVLSANGQNLMLYRRITPSGTGPGGELPVGAETGCQSWQNTEQPGAWRSLAGLREGARPDRPASGGGRAFLTLPKALGGISRHGGEVQSEFAEQLALDFSGTGVNKQQTPPSLLLPPLPRPLSLNLLLSVPLASFIFLVLKCVWPVANSSARLSSEDRGHRSR